MSVDQQILGQGSSQTSQKDMGVLAHILQRIDDKRKNDNLAKKLGFPSVKITAKENLDPTKINRSVLKTIITSVEDGKGIVITSPHDGSNYYIIYSENSDPKPQLIKSIHLQSLETDNSANITNYAKLKIQTNEDTIEAAIYRKPEDMVLDVLNSLKLQNDLQNIEVNFNGRLLKLLNISPDLLRANTISLALNIGRQIANFPLLLQDRGFIAVDLSGNPLPEDKNAVSLTENSNKSAGVYEYVIQPENIAKAIKATIFSDLKDLKHIPSDFTVNIGDKIISIQDGVNVLGRRLPRFTKSYKEFTSWLSPRILRQLSQQVNEYGTATLDLSSAHHFRRSGRRHGEPRVR